MIRIFLCLIFLSFPLQGCHPQGKAEAESRKEMSDPYTWDFGRVKEREVLKHAFTLKNETAKTMTISDVNTSCGCTASKVREKVILPGEKTKIEVEFNSKGYSGLTQQYVYVHTDNPGEPIIRFTIKAEVVN